MMDEGFLKELAEAFKGFGDWGSDFKSKPEPREPQIFETQAEVIEMRVLVAEDGRDTVVTMQGKDENGVWQTTATGRARRRKKEARDFQLGRALAFGRALQHMADKEFVHVEKRLG